MMFQAKRGIAIFKFSSSQKALSKTLKMSLEKSPCWALIWARNDLAEEDSVSNPPVSLNSLFPEDSAFNDSDEDLAEELDECFRFMIWNDLSGEEEEEEDSSFIEDEER